MSERAILLLRFDAPLQSFGGVAVDESRRTMDFPGGSLFAGLLGNALGYDHRDAERLARLQQRLCYAVREETAVAPIRVEDYQTVDLGQDFLQEAWTTRHRAETRGGGSAREGTHIRLREYVADALYLVALALEPEDEEPTVARCAAAVARPERPLFLGRKTCLPAAPLFVAEMRAGDVVEALERTPLLSRTPGTGGTEDGGERRGWWLDAADVRAGGRRLVVYDRRDWENGVHTGRRFVWEGRIQALPRAGA